MKVNENDKVGRWDHWELALDGPSEGNPFTDVELSATLRRGNRALEINGFYDGDGIYRLRFMPDVEGAWQVETHSNAAALDGVRNSFICTPPAPTNRGPVRVDGQYHFRYADGTRYVPVGTTCYAWIHQGEALEEQTLRTLSESPFNKLRMCVFPKDYAYNRNEPPLYPFARDEDGQWNTSRFHPPFFQHLERRIDDLQRLGIEADIILFHPYDRWGFATMDAEADDRYLRYIVARLAAYRNVWWSLANEYDLMAAKSMADWDRFFRILWQDDPHQHLRSIHNCRAFYDHGKPWVTHCSIQHHNLAETAAWREAYDKPVVVDECGYEGDIAQNWGNLSARELVHRCWLGAVGGGYVGHGETYRHAKDLLWWSKGGRLHGESTTRLAFLRSILEEGPVLGPVDVPWRHTTAGIAGQHYLVYFGVHQPGEWPLDLAPDERYEVDVIDPWAMTITPHAPVAGNATVELSAKPYQAARLRRIT